MRDHQRAAVYRAEALAFTDTLLDVPIGLDAVQTLAGMLFTEPWWRRTTGEVVPRVRAARTDATRSVAALDPAGAWVVRIAPGHDQVVTLSHEVAHVLASVAGGSAPPAGGAHGPQFRAAHVAVAAVLLGLHGARLLSTAYRDARLEQLIPPPWAEPPTPDDEHGLYGRWQQAIAL